MEGLLQLRAARPEEVRLQHLPLLREIMQRLVAEVLVEPVADHVDCPEDVAALLEVVALGDGECGPVAVGPDVIP